jgi:predicted peroxiredoxin
MAKLMFAGTAGSDDPTRAAFPLLGARAALDAGHDVEVFLMGEAVYLMKTAVADATNPVGWPNAGEVLREIVGKGGSFYV